MKPLTIEELKALEVGDWVWVKSYDGVSDESYWKIGNVYPEDILFVCNGVIDTHPFNTYGKTWIAYKNKEMAEEAMRDKTIYLLERITEGAVDCINSNDFIDTEQFFKTCERIRNMATDFIARLKESGELTWKD